MSSNNPQDEALQITVTIVRLGPNLLLFIVEHHRKQVRSGNDREGKSEVLLRQKTGGLPTV